MWLKDFRGDVRLWIEVGQPEERPILKACQRADAVHLYAFAHSADVWWRGMQGKLARMDKLQVWRVPSEAAGQLAKMAERSMQLQATIQDGALLMGDARGSVHIELERWK